MPPCMDGWSVFTRPSRLSGKPVTSLTSFTAMPADAICFAVEPVETSWIPAAVRAVASSINPVLSDTEINALFMATTSGILFLFGEQE